MSDAIDALEGLAKGDARGGKYFRRVATGNPKRPWRYYYTRAQYEREHGPIEHVAGHEEAQARREQRGGEVKLTKKQLLHALKHGTYSVISAGRNPNHPDEAKLPEDHPSFDLRHQRLRRQLQFRGFKFTEVEGHYGGKEKSFIVFHDDDAKAARGAKREKSLMVHHKSPSEFSSIRKLGAQYNQDSVIHSHRGQHEMHYTSGENAGKFHKGEGHKVIPHADDFYTHAPTKRGATKFALNFEWDAKHPKSAAMLKAMRASKKAKKMRKHPVSEAQRRWAFVAEERGELPEGKALEWSRRIKAGTAPMSKSEDTMDAIAGLTRLIKSEGGFHKYISKKMGAGGKWEYEYEAPGGGSVSKHPVEHFHETMRSLHSTAPTKDKTPHPHAVAHALRAVIDHASTLPTQKAKNDLAKEIDHHLSAARTHLTNMRNYHQRDRSGSHYKSPKDEARRITSADVNAAGNVRDLLDQAKSRVKEAGMDPEKKKAAAEKKAAASEQRSKEYRAKQEAGAKGESAARADYLRERLSTIHDLVSSNPGKTREDRDERGKAVQHATETYRAHLNAHKAKHGSLPAGHTMPPEHERTRQSRAESEGQQRFAFSRRMRDAIDGLAGLSKGGEGSARGGKYITRTYQGGRWRYTYPDFGKPDVGASMKHGAKAWEATEKTPTKAGSRATEQEHLDAAHAHREAAHHHSDGGRIKSRFAEQHLRQAKKHEKFALARAGSEKWDPQPSRTVPYEQVMEHVKHSTGEHAKKSEDTMDAIEGLTRLVKGGEQAGHKYIKRERHGDRWVYTYAGKDSHVSRAPASVTDPGFKAFRVTHPSGKVTEHHVNAHGDAFHYEKVGKDFEPSEGLSKREAAIFNAHASSLRAAPVNARAADSEKPTVWTAPAEASKAAQAASKYAARKDAPSGAHAQAASAHRRAAALNARANDTRKVKYHERRAASHEQAASRSQVPAYEAQMDSVSPAVAEHASELSRRAYETDRMHGGSIAIRQGPSREHHEDAAKAHEAAASAQEARGRKRMAESHRESAKQHRALASKFGKSQGAHPMIESTPSIRKSFRGLDGAQPLAKGLYKFGDYSQNAKMQAIPDEYLLAYLDAFIEEATEHEMREKAHALDAMTMGPTPGGPEHSLAQWVMNELVSYMTCNANLMRAVKMCNCTKDYIADRISAMGLLKPLASHRTDHGDYLQGFMYSEEQEAGYVGKSYGPNTVLDESAMLKAVAHTRAASRAVDGSPVQFAADDPMQALGDFHRAQRARVQAYYGEGSARFDPHAGAPLPKR